MAKLIMDIPADFLQMIDEYADLVKVGRGEAMLFLFHIKQLSYEFIESDDGNVTMRIVKGDYYG